MKWYPRDTARAVSNTFGIPATFGIMAISFPATLVLDSGMRKAVADRCRKTMMGFAERHREELQQVGIKAAAVALAAVLGPTLVAGHIAEEILDYAVVIFNDITKSLDPQT